MSTWHNYQRPVKLYHATKWTLVIDPPEQTMVLVLYDTEAQAMDAKKKNPHSYVLKPESEYQK